MRSFLPYLTLALFSGVPAAAQGTPPGGPSLLHQVHPQWGGETRQVFTRDVGGATHVWTVGDGAVIRHAVDPQGDDWSFQSPPDDVTQTLLDVFFLPNALDGWACGVGGHVLRTTNGGAAWQHQDGGAIGNALGSNDPATLWRVRFNKADSLPGAVGFTNGLWTFKRWNGSAWVDVQLFDGSTSRPIDRYEFYALELSVNPANPDEWIALAAGQRWGLAGGGHASAGEVFFTRSDAAHGFGAIWHKVFTTTDTGTSYDDPWDIEFEPSPAVYDEAVGYLCGGGGNSPVTGEWSATAMGFVHRFEDGGLTWDATPDLSSVTPPGGHAVATVYGIAALDAQRAVAACYGGQIWHRDVDGNWHLEQPEPGCGPANPCEFTAPLAGAHANAAGEAFVVGSWGFVRKSPPDWSNVTDLNTSSSEDMSEHWRFEAVHFIDENVGFAVGQKKAIVATVDGGADFDLRLNGVFSSLHGRLLSIDFSADGVRGVTVGDSMGPFPLPAAPAADQALGYYTLNGGNHWRISSAPSTLTSGSISAAMLNDVDWVPTAGSLHCWAVGRATISGNSVPLLLRSTDGGAQWVDVNAALGAPIPTGTELSGVAMVSQYVGYCVGSNAGVGHAYRIELGAPTPITSIAPLGAGPLHAVATDGTWTLAVGSAESVYEHFAGTPALTPVVVPALASHPQGLVLTSVAIAPDGSAALIGAAQPSQETMADGLGKLLHFDGTTWRTLASATNKEVCDIQLRSGSSGWLVARGEGSDPEFGQVHDSGVLRFVSVD